VTAVRTDNFNRTNAASLGTPSDAGAAWGAVLGGGHRIVSNTAQGSASDGVSVADLLPTSLAANSYGQAIIGNIGTSGQARYLTGLLRSTSSANRNNCYQFTIGATNESYLTKVVGGTGTDYDSGATSYSAGQLMYWESNGSTHTLKVAGSIVLDNTDTTFGSGGYGGIETYSGSGGAPTFDDLELGELGGGATIYTRKPLSSPIFNSRVIQ
jgi:hypothetical protein